MNKYETFIFKIVNENKLTTDIIINSINKFWDEHMTPLKSNKEVSIIYRVVFYKDNQRITLLKRKSFTNEELKLFQGLVINLFEYNNDEILKNSIVNKIIIKFKVLNSRKEDKINSNFKLQSYRIPMTMNLNDWGNVFNFDSNTKIIRKKFTNSLFKIDPVNNLTNNIELKNDDNKTLIIFTDIRKEGDPLSTFIRIYQHHIYYIYNGKRFFKLNKREATK
jgi:hypothetical protein